MFDSHPTLRFLDIAKLNGGNSWLLPKTIRLHYTYNARGAIYQILRCLPANKGTSVLLPAFHCYVVVEPVIRAGYRPLFYKIREDLSLDLEDLCGKLSSDIAAVVVINYCGFPTNIDPILDLRQKFDFYVVEDWAHSFANPEQGTLNGDKGDVAIFSFYKLVPSYAGGGLRINNPSISYVGSAESVGIKESVVALKRMLEQIVDNSQGTALKSAYHLIEKRWIAIRKKKSPSGDYGEPPLGESYRFTEDLACTKMPWFARVVIRQSDLNEIILARRRNFLFVNDHIRESNRILKVFKNLPGNVCPWAYPVLVKDRSQYDHILRDRGIPVFTFGELLHPSLYDSDTRVVYSAERLSKSLMMLPIHQNLNSNAILSMCEKVNALLGSN